MLARCSTVKNSRCPVGTSAPVWSASETLVRRPTGPWTPAVHALLTHLYEVGFRAAPRPLGIVDQGREVLTFTQGHVVWPDRCFLLESARKPAGGGRADPGLPRCRAGLHTTGSTSAARTVPEAVCQTTALVSPPSPGKPAPWTEGHGDAWRSDAEYIEQREDQWMHALLGD